MYFFVILFFVNQQAFLQTNHFMLFAEHFSTTPFRRGITESSPELADVLYQYPAQQQSKLLQVYL